MTLKHRKMAVVMEKVVSDADLQTYSEIGALFRDSKINPVKRLVSHFLAHW